MAGSVDVRSSAVIQCFHTPCGVRLGKAPENCSDLADHLGIDPASESQYAVGSVGVRMHDENALLQSAGATEVAPVSVEKNIERLFPLCT